MTLVIYDVRNATRIRFENVLQVEAGQGKINGRLVNEWFILFDDGSHKGLPQRHYQIERITN